MSNIYKVTEETVIDEISDELIEEILDIEFHSSDWGTNTTLREYLSRLAIDVIVEEESFSGKRPFGNSGWIGTMAPPMIKAGVIIGSYKEPDEEDRYAEYDYDDRYEIVEVVKLILNYLYRKKELAARDVLQAAYKNASDAFRTAVEASHAAQQGADEEAKIEAVLRVHAASATLLEAKQALDKVED